MPAINNSVESWGGLTRANFAGTSPPREGNGIAISGAQNHSLNVGQRGLQDFRTDPRELNIVSPTGFLSSLVKRIVPVLRSTKRL